MQAKGWNRWQDEKPIYIFLDIFEVYLTVISGFL